MKFSVPTMSCDHCKGKIQQALDAIDGVNNIQIDLETKSVSVDSNLEPSAVVSAIEAVGYEAIAQA